MSLRNLLIIMGVSLSLGLPLAAMATTVYRSTDAQGNAVFSDQPDRGGERVELPQVTVVPSRSASERTSGERTGRDADDERSEPQRSVSATPFMPYSRFRIASPEDEATLPTGSAGNVQVELAIEPELREEHQVRLLIDGRVSQSAMHTTAFMLTNLDRGEHELQAELLDGDGQVRHRSAPVTLYVQRASVNLPQNPN